MSIQFITAQEAVQHIKDNDCVLVDGFVGTCVAEELLIALENRFLQSQCPKDLTILYTSSSGDRGSRGLNHIAHEGLIKCVIGGHYALSPKIGDLAINNKIEGYNFPQGVISQMFRDIAAKRPATISRVGLGTFVDPDIEGGKLNSITKKDLVSKITINNQECLCFDHVFPKIAFLRGTYADDNGNISCEKEACLVDVFAAAMATHNSGGKVIVQVEKRVSVGSIDPKMVTIPCILVDYVVICEDPKNHMQTWTEQFNPEYIKNDPSTIPNFTPMELDERKIIARRCATMINEKTISVNFGIGMPEGIASILHEEDIIDKIVASVEVGVVGGTPASGLSFGASLSPQAIIDQPSQFDFYDGGGLDIAFLGLAQCDEQGNINVSKFGPKIAGCGGFINITQNAKEVVFCGTFTTGGLEIRIDQGKLQIVKEGKTKKFVKSVEQITFSGQLAAKAKQSVTYVTERAIFVLTDKGLELIEIADGIDLEKDVLAQMDFTPKISKNIKKMDPRFFRLELVGMK